MSNGYQALKSSAAWLDVSLRGRLRATGEDRVRLLHALATNDIQGLAPGEGTRTFFLNAQGRIQAVCRVYCSADSLLLDCDADRRRLLLEYLDSYIIMDDVTITDETAETVAIAVEGPLSANIVQALGSAALSDAADSHRAAGALHLHRSALTGQPGFWIGAPASEKTRLIERLERAGTKPATASDFNMMRVRNKQPLLGVDYTDRNIPHESQQLALVNFQKGCYVGQEIVERVRSQGRVNRLLTPLEVDAPELTEDREVRLDGRTVGELTSAVAPPDAAKTLGFALLRREAVEAGKDLAVGGFPARVLAWT